MAFIGLSMLCACGGGGGGGSASTPVADPPASPDPPGDTRALTIVDAVPAAGAINANPAFGSLRVAHLGTADLALTFSADCENLSVNTFQQPLFDLSSSAADQLLDHRATCSLEPSSAYRLTAETHPNAAPIYTLEQAFSTGPLNTPGLLITDSVDLPRSEVNQLFQGYVQGALPGQLDLPAGIESLVLNLLIDIADSSWNHLANPGALYDVRNLQVAYASRTPDGAASNQLTGLVSMPIIATASQFAPRDRIIVLTHATGSTPSALSPADAWFILASQFASRGYLVIAPDNYGRGGTASADETYLLDYQTAQNGFDLVSQVLADPEYDAVNSGNDLTIIGYSQGGHSAIGLWKMLETQGSGDLVVREVHAGGAPHNLYRTFRGVLQYLDGSCAGDDYCRYVDRESTLPFATDRILPGLLGYTETGLATDDLIDEGTIRPDFIAGFLSDEATYDLLKVQLQLNSFTGMIAGGNPLAGSVTGVHLYHSAFDRLVPEANTRELAAALEPLVTVDFDESRCNADGYELLFNLTDKVGVLHTLCGLSVLDEVMSRLR
ncbi:MAG: alpha/beta fold hydrolase [Proteobacteria bacterium]|nr:alpha/beta fold hydrolase [Pseudomonadota bacterium]